VRWAGLSDDKKSVSFCLTGEKLACWSVALESGRYTSIAPPPQWKPPASTDPIDLENDSSLPDLVPDPSLPTAEATADGVRVCVPGRPCTTVKLPADQRDDPQVDPSGRLLTVADSSGHLVYDVASGRRLADNIYGDVFPLRHDRVYRQVACAGPCPGKLLDAHGKELATVGDPESPRFGRPARVDGNFWAFDSSMPIVVVDIVTGREEKVISSQQLVGKKSFWSPAGSSVLLSLPRGGILYLLGRPFGGDVVWIDRDLRIKTHFHAPACP
jgi:hypothetical protein